MTDGDGSAKSMVSAPAAALASSTAWRSEQVAAAEQSPGSSVVLPTVNVAAPAVDVASAASESAVAIVPATRRAAREFIAST